MGNRGAADWLAGFQCGGDARVLPRSRPCPALPRNPMLMCHAAARPACLPVWLAGVQVDATLTPQAWRTS